MKKLTLLLALFIAFTQTQAQEKAKEDNSKRLEWFKDAKLGIFIHWGIYGVNGITESWSMKNKHISWEDYMKQLDGFTAKNYNPKQWAKLFKEIGADYVVLTSKHHDGVALYPTKFTKLNVVESTPAKRDLIGPYVDALREEGLKVGLYYSICDWSHIDYDPATFERPKSKLKKLYPQNSWEKKYLNAQDRFNRFNHGMIEEISKMYKPDLYWFDGDWEHPAEWWRAQEIKDSLLSWNPNCIVNSRLQGYGDYQTPEQAIPINTPEGPWEFCVTMNDNWGYFPSDTNYKPFQQIINYFVKTLSGGGNLLLNIGPKPDGTLDETQVKYLKTLGQWINKHQEVVRNTHSGIPSGHFNGPTMLSKDNKTLYLALINDPKGYIELSGLDSKIEKIRVVGTDEQLNWVLNGPEWAAVPELVRIDLPSEKNLDNYVTIIAVELNDVIDLYRDNEDEWKPREL